MHSDSRKLENQLLASGYQCIVGIDEAGRGCLAGPVVAAAVSIPRDVHIEGVTDSKRLSPQKREQLLKEICQHAQVGIGQASPEEVDQLNVLQATFAAMKRAVEALSIRPDYCLVDGSQVIPQFGIAQRAIVRGDSSCFLISAASIVAKVTRDRLMLELHEKYPHYGFSSHKGYPTAEHRKAIRKWGPCPIHRLSFGEIGRGRVS